VSSEVDVVPDGSEATVGGRTHDSAPSTPAEGLPAGASDTASASPVKRRARLALFIVLGLLAFAGAWWGTQALLGLLNPVAAGEHGQEGGYTYNSSDGVFEIAFPGEPEVTNSPISDDFPDLQETTVTWSSESAVYSVATTEWPADVVADIDRPLEDLLYGLRASIPGEELREKTTGSLDGVPALTGMIAGEDRDIWFTAAMHGSTQVILTVAVPTGEPAPAFVETFRFLD
jgi:hypothetical protein